MNPIQNLSKLHPKMQTTPVAIFIATDTTTYLEHMAPSILHSNTRNLPKREKRKILHRNIITQNHKTKTKNCLAYRDMKVNNTDLHEHTFHSVQYFTIPWTQKNKSSKQGSKQRIILFHIFILKFSFTQFSYK